MYLRIIFQVSTIVLTSFRQGVILPPPPQKEPLESPPRLGLINIQAFRPATSLKRDSNTDFFLRNCKIFKNSFFTEHLLWLRLTIEQLHLTKPELTLSEVSNSCDVSELCHGENHNGPHCRRFSLSQISQMPRAGFEPARSLSSGFVE